MAQTATKVDTLVDEDAGMERAMETVLDTAEEKGVVEWSDVSDDLTSGQWGRLIEKGILVDADGSGFVVDDPEGLKEAIGYTGPTSTSSPASSGSGGEDEDGDSSWSKWDKIALVASIAMFAGYSVTSIRNQVGQVVDIFIGPLDAVLPFYLVILVLAILTGLYSTILQDQLTNLDNMGGYQEKQKELREREKKAKERGDDEALEEIREEQMAMMGDNLGMMKEQFRSMPWIMLLTIPVFLWIYWMVFGGNIDAASGPVLVMPLVGELGSWRDGVIGPMQGWIFWYIICSFGLSQVIRKALNVQTSPT